MEKCIYLQPLVKTPGEVESSVLDRLRRELPGVFGLDCIAVSPMDLMDVAYSPLRGQYLAAEILADTKSRRYPGADRVLAITSHDLYADGLSFVFGQAELEGKFAIISTYRLKGATSEGDGRLFYLRVLKEATHELGHTFGLGHCPDLRCIMHFSNTLRDTDLKGPGFCGDCSIKLSERLQRMVHR